METFIETLTSIRTNCYKLLDKPRIYADLNGGWRVGDEYIVPLNSSATTGDLRSLGYTLSPGLTVDFWTDDGDDEGNLDPLLFQGIIQFDNDTQHWVAVTDWNKFYHASEINKPNVQEVTIRSSDLFDTHMEHTETNLKSSAKAGAAPKQPLKL